MLDRPIYFPPFRLDVPQACLWRGAERITLIPKDFAILMYLAMHPQRLVSHAEIFQEVWKGTIVSHGALKVHLCRIRRALNDDATNPRFIETVPRRGYRFIASVAMSAAGSSDRVRSSDFDSVLSDLRSALAVVDQEKNFVQVNEWLDEMLWKVRSLAFPAQCELSRAV